jgi:hypothetical protein
LARDIHIEVKLKEGNVRAAWGLNPVITYGDSGMIRFEVPAIHSGDYETAMVELKLPEKSKAGKRPVLTVRTRYKDLRGIVHELNPVGVTLEFVTASNPIAGFSDARVLKSGTMLHYALELQRISGTYQQYSDVYQAFFRSFEMKKELRNAATRLGDNSFADEIGVLENYMRITGKEIGFKKAVVEQIIADDELIPPEMDRPLKEHLDYLFRELVSRLSEAPPGTLAVSGFSVPGKDRVPFAEVVNEAGAVYLKTFLGSEYPVLERRKLDEILREQELALSDLGEPNQAIRIGKFLAANYLVTGTIIPMSESVVIFGRILNVETAVIEAVAQVIVPRSDEISSLL